MKLLRFQKFSRKVQHMQSESIAVFWKIVTSIPGHCSFVSYRSLNSNSAEYVPLIILIAFPRRISKNNSKETEFFM